MNPDKKCNILQSHVTGCNGSTFKRPDDKAVPNNVITVPDNFVTIPNEVLLIPNKIELRS